MANNWRKPDTWSVETQHKAKYLLFVTGLAIAAVLVGFTGWSLTHHHTSADAHAPAPRATASGKHTSTPAPLPSYEPPAYPLKAKTNNQEGAKAFLEYFFDELNYAGWTGDTTQFEKLYEGDNCRPCQIFKKLIQNGLDKGFRLYKGAYKITTTSFTQQPMPNAYQGVFTAERDEAGLVDRSGNVSDIKTPIKNQEGTFYITWMNDHFVMNYLNEVKK